MAYYLTLPRLEISHANAQASGHVINACPVMAITLFAHNLARHVYQSSPYTLPYEQVRVAILHHDAQLLGEGGANGFFNFQPQLRRGATFIDKTDYSSKNPHALSLQPTATCHLTLTLLLELPAAPNLDEVKAFLRQARLAGGKVERHEAPTVQSGDVEDLLSQLPGGFWVVERTDLMQTDPDPLTALYRAIAYQHADPAPLPLAEKAGDDHAPAKDWSSDTPRPLPMSWLVPTVLGYAGITPFARRGGVRMSNDRRTGELTTPDHAFAEPLLGLVQYVGRRRWVESHPIEAIPFWQPQWLQDDVFVVTQTGGEEE